MLIHSMITRNFYFFVFAHIIFESMPISSSGHLRLLMNIMGYSNDLLGGTFKVFEGLLHAPNLVIIAFLMKKRWIFLLTHPWRGRRQLARLIFLGMVAESATLFWYFLLKAYTVTIPLWVGFGMTSVLLLSLTMCKRPTKGRVTLFQALVIGCVQGIAVLPGISRLASTYVVGCWLGLTPISSFRFSLTIEWPLIALAFLTSCIDYCSVAGSFSLDLIALFLWCLPASVVSYRALLFTQEMATRRTLWRFGVYMIAPALFSFFYSHGLRILQANT